MGQYFILQQVPRWGNQSDGRDRARMEGTHRGRQGTVRERDRPFRRGRGGGLKGGIKGAAAAAGKGLGWEARSRGICPQGAALPPPGGLRLNADAGG